MGCLEGVGGGGAAVAGQEGSAAAVLLRVFDEAVDQQARFVPAGGLARSEATQQRGAVVAAHLPLAERARPSAPLSFVLCSVAVGAVRLLAAWLLPNR